MYRGQRGHGSYFGGMVRTSEDQIHRSFQKLKNGTGIGKLMSFVRYYWTFFRLDFGKLAKLSKNYYFSVKKYMYTIICITNTCSNLFSAKLKVKTGGRYLRNESKHLEAN